MKALQLRKKQMEKRAEEKRNRQAEENLSPIPDASENKENVARVKEDSQQIREDDQPSKSVKGKEPLSEIQASAAPEPIEPSETKPASSDLSKPDSTADTTVSDSEGDHSSNTSPPSTAATFSTDHKETLESNRTSISHAEPNAMQEDPIVSGHEAGDGPSSTSADVPLGNNFQATPETENVLPQQTATPPSDREEPAPTETAESIPPPGSSPSMSRPTSAADSSTVTATSAPEPEQQEDLPIPETSDAVKEADEQKEKRKHNLEPIQVPTPEYSDDDNLSDDSFMDELQSATVEEAKPVSVGKSPLTPGFESDRQSPDPWQNNRAVSNPAFRHQSNLPTVSVGRSVSSPFYSEMGGSSVMMAKKINVSSGISSRIKALEKFSGRDQPANLNQNLPHDPLRRQASFTLGGMESTSVSRRASYISQETSRAPNVQRPASQLSSNPTRTPSSVSVTARIVRDQAGPSDPVEPAELQASQLTIEHETPETPLSRTTTADSANKSEKRSMSASSSGSRRPSLARMGRSDSRLSVSSRSKGEAIPESEPASDVPSSPDEKKESRTSRMLRRMSSITSSPRRSIMGAKSQTVEEEQAVPTSEPGEPNGHDTKNTTPQAVDIGEVNIQFPDTLLWKRRYMRIDDKGFLVFAPGNTDSTNRNLIKRYHLTEFITPCLPDEDRQELPNSILLDFVNGSTLQAACESRQGQESVLQSKLPNTPSAG